MNRCQTPEAYADARKVSVRTVHRWIQAGIVPAAKVGRTWRILPANHGRQFVNKNLQAEGKKCAV